MKDNKKFWDRVSKLYKPLQEKTNEHVFAQISNLSENFILHKSVLEVGCGSGQITKYLSQKATVYVASDFSEKMINECVKRNIPNVKYRVEDINNLSFEDNSFDVVIAANILHIIPNPEKAMAEIKRVLKPNGILVSPTFVYEGKVNKFRLNMTKLVGFKTYNEWNLNELENFICSYDFEIIIKKIISASPIAEGFLLSFNVK